MNGTESITATKTPAPADLQRWSEELARNPASLAFLPLARAYRRQGRLDLALKLCLGGLEQHPNHVEAHALLALLYLESGDRAKAADEWATVLRLKPGNFEALRGMGFRYLEQGEAGKARQHLERAALIRPEDAVVQEALRLLRQRHDEPAAEREPEPSEAVEGPAAGTDVVQPRASAGPAAPASPDRVRPDVAAADEAAFEPWAEPPDEPAARSRAAESAQVPWAQNPPAERAAPTGPSPGTAEAAPPGTFGSGARPPAAAAAPRTAPAPAADPVSLFERILAEPPALGVLLLDRRGFLLAGRLREEAAGRADDVGALLASAVEEAVRTATHLELGAWRMLRIEANAALVHVVPAGGDALIAIAARRDTPLGWLIRSATVAASVAAGYLEGAHGG